MIGHDVPFGPQVEEPVEQGIGNPFVDEEGFVFDTPAMRRPVRHQTYEDDVCPQVVERRGIEGLRVTELYPSMLPSESSC